MKKSERILVGASGVLVVTFFGFQVNSFFNKDAAKQAYLEEILAEHKVQGVNSNDNHIKAALQDGGSYLVDIQQEAISNSLNSDASLDGSLNARAKNSSAIQLGIITQLYKSGFGWITGNRLKGYKALSTAKGSKEHNGLVYADVYPDTDIRYRQDQEARKMDIVFNNPETFASIPNEAEDFVFVEHIKVPEGWNAHLVNDQVKIYDANNKFVMVYPKPKAKDAQGNFKEGAYSLDKTNDGFVLQLSMNMDWLKDEARAYPIIIDPSFEMIN